MKKTAIGLIVIGLLLFVLPSVTHWTEDYRQKKLLDSWDASRPSDLTETESIEAASSELTRIFAEENGQTASSQQFDSNAAEDKPASTAENKDKADRSNPPVAQEVKTVPVKTGSANVKASHPEAKPASPVLVGVIEIDDIGLKLPMLEGVSSQNLKIAAGHIPGTALPGQVGNSTIAAHNSYSYGRMFSRIKELNPGSRVLVKTAAGTFEYTIFEIKTVQPSDTAVLNRSAKDKVLTLITCDDKGKNRLVIHGKLD